MYHLKIVVLLAGLAMVANSQVLTTAEPIGKGKKTVFASSSALRVKGFTTLTSSNAQLVYGVSDKVDVYLGGGPVTALGQAQGNALAGANVNLVKSKRVSISTYNLLSTGLHKRRESASLLWLGSVVASKNFEVRKFAFTGYTGYAATVPLGRNRADKLFTPPSPVHNLPVGVCVPRGKYAVFAEYNFGRKVQVLGVGLGYTF